MSTSGKSSLMDPVSYLLSSFSKPSSSQHKAKELNYAALPAPGAAPCHGCSPPMKPSPRVQKGRAAKSNFSQMSRVCKPTGKEQEMSPTIHCQAVKAALPYLERCWICSKKWGSRACKEAATRVIIALWWRGLVWGPKASDCAAILLPCLLQTHPTGLFLWQQGGSLGKKQDLVEKLAADWKGEEDPPCSARTESKKSQITQPLPTDCEDVVFIAPS